MARLVDADKLRKDVLDLPNCYDGFSDTYDKAMILALVDEQPTIEAEPIRHGHWKPYKTEQGRTFGVYCSECRKWLLMNPTPHCPNCGAKMDEEVNENETD